MFSTGEVFSTLKRIEGEDSPALADLRTAGTGATAPGGHPSMPGHFPTISAPAGARDVVRARLAEGSDFIKVMYDDVARFGAPRPMLSEDTLQAVIDAAKAQGAVWVVHGELSLLVEHGLTPLQALIAATSAPADAFRRADRGRSRPGLRADLVLVEGDPSRDILATRNSATPSARARRRSHPSTARMNTPTTRAA